MLAARSLCVEAVASARHGTRRFTDLAPSPVLARCWLVRLTFDRPANASAARALRGSRARTAIPVGDATALGTLRTRLETRTKESNMYASHWDLTVYLKAK